MRRLASFPLCVLSALYLITAPACRSAPGSTEARSDASDRAWLGAATRTPSDAEAEELGLPFEVRLQGQTVAAVVSGGPASAAGVRTGDVILRLGENTLHSQDDVRDFLSAAQPGERVELTVRRTGTTGDLSIPVVLGRSPDPHVARPSIEWEFASLAQLPRAMAKAEAQSRALLIGLSGAET